MSNGTNRNRRRLIAVGGVVLVLGASGLTVQLVHPFDLGTAPSAQAESAAKKRPGALASVTRRDLAARTRLDGVLGYAGQYTLVNKATGTLTELPSVGKVAKQGDVLYEVDGRPVVVLYGKTPVYRTMQVYDEGPDVRQLNEALVELGYGKDVDLSRESDYFDWRTRYAVQEWQDDLGVDDTGEVELGRVLFIPKAVRITKVNNSIGGSAGPGPLFEATSTSRQVKVELGTAQQSILAIDDPVTVSLSSGARTPGRVSRIGEVVSENEQGERTVDVVVDLTRPKDVREFGQGPVTVLVTTDRVTDVLTVPVNSLVALADGGYAVEVVRSGSNDRRLVPVTLGLFDHAAGVVEVSGKELTEGQHVVVPSG